MGALDLVSLCLDKIMVQCKFEASWAFYNLCACQTDEMFNLIINHPNLLTKIF